MEMCGLELSFNIFFLSKVLANGDAGKFNFTEIKLLGCAVTGLDLDDLKKLNLDIDVIAELGKHASWTSAQVISYSLLVFLYIFRYNSTQPATECDRNLHGT